MWIYVCMQSGYICICMYVYMCIYIYVYIYVCVYIYIYILIYMYIQESYNNRGLFQKNPKDSLSLLIIPKV